MALLVVQLVLVNGGGETSAPAWDEPRRLGMITIRLGLSGLATEGFKDTKESFFRAKFCKHTC